MTKRISDLLIEDKWYLQYLAEATTEADIIDGKNKAEAYQELLEKR